MTGRGGTRVRGPRGRAGARAAAAPLTAALAVGAAVALVALVDPNEPGHYPPCPFLALTGLYCPGCGGLRAVHALAHGDLVAALGFNPLAVVMLPVVVLLWGGWVARAWQGRPFDVKVIHPAYIWVFLGVMIVFWIARNTPYGTFLAP
ncbi:membrane protein [Streptosporangium violaceochromogenes]|nr:membrane protein [Streptosporangium violaceochromogenes]